MREGFETPPPQGQDKLEWPAERDPAKEVPEHFNALVVLGKNWREYPSAEDDPKKFKLRLSIESKMAALAAGEMFKEGLMDKIIFSGGRTAGKDYPSEGGAMMEYLKKKYPDIPVEALGAEDESIDTAENAEKIAEMMAKDPTLQKIALMTIGYHMPRAERLFEEYGIEAAPFPSEEELEKRSPRYKQFVESYLRSDQVKVEKAKELILRSLLYIDAKGKIPRALTKKLRHTD